MQDAAAKEKVRIGKTVKLIRTKLNISVQELADTLVLSTGTIKSIEAGKAASVDNIIQVIYFFGLTLNEASDPKYQIPLEPQLRQSVIAFHHKHKIPDKNGLLKKAPKVRVILTDRIFPQGYLNEPKPIRYLKEICENEYGIKISSSTLSNAMNELVEEQAVIICNPKDKYHLYRKKK